MTTAAKLVCGLMLLALFGAACASEKAVLVDPTIAPDDPGVPTTTAPGSNGASGAPTTTAAGQPGGSDPNPSGDGSNDGSAAPTTTAASGTPSDSGSDAGSGDGTSDGAGAGTGDGSGSGTSSDGNTGSNGGTGTGGGTTPAPAPLPQLTQTNVASPYGNSFQVTVMVANSNTQRFVPIYDAPNGNEIILPDRNLWYRTYYNNPLVMQVVQGNQSDAWVRVKVQGRQAAPERNCTEPPCYKNDIFGWVQNTGYDWMTHNYHGVIDLSERSVRVWNGTQLVAETLAVIGRQGRETPLGSFFLAEKAPPLNAAYGTHMLLLSGYSEQLNDFGANNGLPVIAIHGTNQPHLIGQAVSSGCIRVPNNVIRTIHDSAPLGTVFEIVV